MEREEERARCGIGTHCGGVGGNKGGELKEREAEPGVGVDLSFT